MSRIRVTIDELVLKGIAAGDRNALVDGLRSELARVLSDPVAREVAQLKVPEQAMAGAGGAARPGAGLATPATPRVSEQLRL